VRQGHETLIVGPPTLNARGYPFKAGAAPPDEVLGPIWREMPALPPGQGDVVVVGVIFARLNVEAMLPTLEAAIDEFKPDLVLREGAEFASAIAAERREIPHVRVAVGFALVEESLLAIAGPALDERHPGIVERIAGSPYLSCFPETIDPAPFEVSRFRHPATEASRGPLPAGVDGSDRPLVYVSFGSVAATFPPAARVYRSALDAVADLPVRVLLTTGGNDVALGEVPANVQVEKWVDEPRTLGHAAAVVGHGGAGTTLSAMAAGCPLVAVPLFGDQPANAVRVAVAGAGVVAPFDGIREGIELVLEKDGYRAEAQRVAGEMRALPAIEGFLAAPLT
jgi:UDP-glucoronosyl and UDP-glucosyl transferase